MKNPNFEDVKRELEKRIQEDLIQSNTLINSMINNNLKIYYSDMFFENHKSFVNEMNYFLDIIAHIYGLKNNYESLPYLLTILPQRKELKTKTIYSSKPESITIH